MTEIEKNEAFKKTITQIERTYKKRLLFPISHYFEWRTHPYNLVFDTKKSLDYDIKELVIKSYNEIFK